MVMELAIGRASKQNIGLSLKTLTPEKKGWHWYGHVAIAGNYVPDEFLCDGIGLGALLPF